MMSVGVLVAAYGASGWGLRDQSVGATTTTDIGGVMLMRIVMKRKEKRGGGLVVTPSVSSIGIRIPKHHQIGILGERTVLI
jgi:hypothetical protein